MNVLRRSLPRPAPHPEMSPHGRDPRLTTLAQQPRAQVTSGYDLRHTGNILTATAGASMRELMVRMGHASTRAALVYLHDTDDRQCAIATVISDLARPGLGSRTRHQGGLRGMQQAREGHNRLTMDLRRGVSQVELRGLEPLTPCLQNRPKLSDTVAHLGSPATRASAEMVPCPILLWSSLVVSIHGVSVAVAGHRQSAPPPGGSVGVTSASPMCIAQRPCRTTPTRRHRPSLHAGFSVL